MEKILSAITSSMREIDLIGWYEKDSTLGVIVPELGQADLPSALNIIHSRVNVALRNELSLKDSNEIHISFHVYPEDEIFSNGPWQADLKLYPDLTNKNGTLPLRVKRAVDIVGGLIAIILLSPLMLVIAFALKLSSKGPVLFCQQRVGQYGSLFTFYKFRSMYFKAESTVHEKYAKEYIAGQAKAEKNSGVYKLCNDARVTPLGRFLRRTSLDELPQLFNVLKGEMSLVGPRPPIPYEVGVYSPWHRRRLLEAKPGITGLWQVSGRCKTGFSDMVRLDLRYAAKRSFWMDIMILAKTVLVVVSRDGAY
jgi:lipopolysaccharide/colanic/teichoic acid biosynthesis glycosyltransferase